ncbi:MAG: lytic transglycosylase domain-containing protein [Clostridia bacterium]|nr:lytic transglycosylase domain-containing protein [Clostridia bacterium]
MCLFYPNNYKLQVSEYSRKYDVSTELVYGVIRAESRFDKDAVSEKGAIGLMQIMESTGDWAAESIGLTDVDLFDVDANIEIGCFYLSYLLDKYDGNTRCAVAAYNAGQTNVDKWLATEEYSKDGKNLDKIPFAETEKYVEKVLENIKKYSFLY